MSFVKSLSLVLAVVAALSAPLTVLAQTKESETTSMTSTETPPAQETGKDDSPGAAYAIGAVLATAVSLPMHGALCGVSGGIGLVVLVVTFGSGYRAAARVVEEGCGGTWIITPKHLKGTEEPKREGYN